MDAASYYVASVVGSVAEAAVDGTFTDDVTGLPNEHHAAQGRLGKPHDHFRGIWTLRHLMETPFLQEIMISRGSIPPRAPAIIVRTGMSDVELKQLQLATNATHATLVRELIARGEHDH